MPTDLSALLLKLYQLSLYPLSSLCLAASNVSCWLSVTRPFSLSPTCCWSASIEKLRKKKKKFLNTSLRSGNQFVTDLHKLMFETVCCSVRQRGCCDAEPAKEDCFCFLISLCSQQCGSGHVFVRHSKRVGSSQQSGLVGTPG